MKESIQYEQRFSVSRLENNDLYLSISWYEKGNWK